MSDPVTLRGTITHADRPTENVYGFMTDAEILAHPCVVHALAAAEARGFERASAMARTLLNVRSEGNPDQVLRIKRVRDSFGLAEPGNVAPGRPGLRETLDTLRECDWDEVRARALLIERGHAKEPR